MEKKKLSIGTVIILLVIVAAIAVAATYMIIKTEKQNTNSNGVENNSESLDTAKTENENKTTNTTADIKSNTNSNTNTTNNIGSTSKTEENKFSEDTIKKSIQSYLNLVGKRDGSPSGMLQELKLMKEEPDGNPDNDNYKKTNIKWSTFKSAMMNYMTEEWFNSNGTQGLKEVNGIVYYFDGGSTGTEYEVESITIKGDYSDAEYIAKVNNIALDGSKESEDIEFGVTNQNGKCVISYCDL